MKRTALPLLALLMALLLAAPAWAETFATGLDCTIYQTGDVYISWDDSQSAPPYTVSLTAQDTQLTTELDEPCQTCEANVSRMIPGLPYVITVANAAGEKFAASFTLPRTEHPAYGGRVTLDRESVSIADLEDDPSTQLELNIKMPAGEDVPHTLFMTALRTPEGYHPYTTSTLRVQLPTEGECELNMVYPIYDLLGYIARDFGHVPMGEYAMEIYLGGMLLGEAPLNVGP